MAQLCEYCYFDSRNLKKNRSHFSIRLPFATYEWLQLIDKKKPVITYLEFCIIYSVTP